MTANDREALVENSSAPSLRRPQGTGRGMDDHSHRFGPSSVVAQGWPGRDHGLDPAPQVPADLSRFDRDPDALEWAREKVRDFESRWRKFSKDAAEAGKPDVADIWRYLANGVHASLIGGSGCVIGAFDERRASLPPVADGEPR